MEVILRLASSSLSVTGTLLWAAQSLHISSEGDLSAPGWWAISKGGFSEGGGTGEWAGETRDRVPS